MIDSQAIAGEELLTQTSNTLMKEHSDLLKELGLRVQHDPQFKKAVKNKKLDLMRSLINDEFFQYYVTTGVLTVNKIYVLNKEYKILAESTEGDAHNITENLCLPQIELAKLRKGAERVKPLIGWCSNTGYAFNSVIVPINSLNPLGYIQIVSEPYNVLRKIEERLSVPLQIITPDGSVRYQSQNWESAREDESNLVISHKVYDERNTEIIKLLVAKDVSNIIEPFTSSQLKIVIAVTIITLFAVIFFLLILEKHLIAPITSLVSHLNLIKENETNLGLNLIPDGSAEVRLITSSFNELNTNLAKSYGDLTRHKNNLEEMIVERTRDLSEAKNEAELANKSKSEFLANMSHDLRTPLHAILSFSDFGLKKINVATLEKLEEYFSYINVSGKRLLNLVNDLLDVSKLESGEIEMDFQPHDLRDISCTIIREVQVLLNDKKQILTMSEEPAFVQCDRQKMEQVIQNLLSNASKFTPEGKVISIDISINNEDESVTFELKDQGVGIPDDELSKVFDKFVQSSKNDSGSGGTGLGLAICKEIILLHAGEIVAENNEVGGAVFRFRIPVSQDTQ